MNERIKVLAKTVDACYIPRYDMWQMDTESLKKFAELIVKECIEHLEGTVLVPNIEHSRTKTKCIRSIKEHFGVEE